MSRIGGKCPLTFSRLTCHLINLLLSGSGQCEREAAKQQSLQHSQSSRYTQLLKKIILLRYISKISSPQFQFPSYLTPSAASICTRGAPCVPARGSSVCPRSPAAPPSLSLSIPAPGLGNAPAELARGIQVVQRRAWSDKILTGFGIHLWRMTLVPQKSLWCTGNS